MKNEAQPIRREGFCLGAADAARFAERLAAIRCSLEAARGPEDVRHLRKIETWGRAFTLLGYGTAWLSINPVAWIGMALGMSARWMIVAHHVLHGGYDACAGVPRRYKSRGFAGGGRRWLDWCDWLEPRAWQREHNGQHHHRLGEKHDPDVPEQNFLWLRRLPLPIPLKYAAFLLTGFFWKWGYYGPNLMLRARHETRAETTPFNFFAAYLWNPLKNPVAREVWTRSWLPYAAVRFGILPLPFLLLGERAWWFVLMNSLAAELLTNFHTFVVIVTNHAGAELPRYDEPPAAETEHLLRQIVGSVNFPTGSDWNDFLYGWLNYQIEHHLWPNLTLLQYRLAQPQVKALCGEFGVPYLQEPVFRRFLALARNAVGAETMWRVPALIREAQA